MGSGHDENFDHKGKVIHPVPLTAFSVIIHAKCAGSLSHDQNSRDKWMGSDECI